MSRTTYKKIGISVSFLIFCFFINPSAYAETNVAPTETLNDLLFTSLGSLLNLIYLITLPILIFAGKAMDNAMVYGEFINLDKPLYMLRNLSRSFANFAVGGVILRKIIEYIFSNGSGESPGDLKKIIIKSTGMVLAINFSWFAIGALLDLSTIATYGLGAMPLSILKNTSNKDMPILSVASYFDYSSKESQKAQGPASLIPANMYYQRGAINIPKCGGESRLYKSFIVGPEYYPLIPNTDKNGSEGIRFDNFGSGPQYCALTPQTLVDITALESIKNEHVQQLDNSHKNLFMKQVIDHITTTTGACGDITLTGTDNNSAAIGITIQADELNKIIDTLTIGDGQIPSKSVCGGTKIISKNAYQLNNRQDEFTQKETGIAPYNTQNGLTMHSLIDKSKGMVGPFITLYMTLLDFSNLSTQNTQQQDINSTLGLFTEFILKAIISIALLIPLIALAIVLIIRVVILRGVIAFIPLGIVVSFLGEEIGMGKGEGIKLGDKLGEINGKSIIGLIFAPVLPVFTISISIIILQTLQISMKDAISNDNKTWDFMGVSFSNTTENTTCMDYWGMTNVCFDKGESLDGGSGFANFLPRLFLNIFAIGLMWMMVKISLSGSKITGQIGGDIMDLGKNALGSIPIMRLGGKKIGASSLANTPSILDRSIQAKLSDTNATYDHDLAEYISGKPKNTTYTPIKNKESTENLNKTVTTATQDYTIPALRKLHSDIIGTHETEDQKEAFDKLSPAQYSTELLKSITTLTDKGSAITKKITGGKDAIINHGLEDFLSDKTAKKIDATKKDELLTYLNNDNIKSHFKTNIPKSLTEQGLQHDTTSDKFIFATK